MPGRGDHRRKSCWVLESRLWVTSTVTLYFHTNIIPACLSGIPILHSLTYNQENPGGIELYALCFQQIVPCQVPNNWIKWGNHSSSAALQMLAQCWILAVLIASRLLRHPCHRQAALMGASVALQGLFAMAAL